MRRREHLHHREDERRRVVLEVQRERDRRALGALAPDERAVGPGAAEVADQLATAGKHVLLDARPVSGRDLAQHRAQGQHLLQRAAITEQAALEQRVPKARDARTTGPPSRSSAKRCEFGITFWDTANICGAGSSERNLNGWWARAPARRALPRLYGRLLERLGEHLASDGG